MTSKHPSEDSDFKILIDAIENMDPDEARIMFRNILSEMEEEGEQITFPLRLLTSEIYYGVCPTPVGLAYGIGGLGQLLLAGFIREEEIKKPEDIEAILQEVIEDFEENMLTITLLRNDEFISKMIKSALEGTYVFNDEIFEALEGTDLQQAVWKELTKIPYGQTISYEELALRIGSPKAVRAVASAVGDNPISIAIPCHRIVLKSGRIGEYHWGSDIKEKLIAYEQAKK
ncbi:MAG: MGMT family protein [Alphaproteobacteria bacterium]|nr:MGMT family protein [Alphaproteobacteria bacterium]